MQAPFSMWRIHHRAIFTSALLAFATSCSWRAPSPDVPVDAIDAVDALESGLAIDCRFTPMPSRCTTDGWCAVDSFDRGGPWCWRPEFIGLCGHGPDDAWTIGWTVPGRPTASTLWHWNGTQWTHDGTRWPGALYGIACVGDRDVWAVGDAGLVLHFDGVRWTQVDIGTTASLSDVWGTAADDVWLVESMPTASVAAPTVTFHHYDGSRFASMPMGPATGGFAIRMGRIWGRARDDVYAAGTGSYPCEDVHLLHWDGVSWGQTSLTTGCSWRHLPLGIAIWGTNDRDLSVVAGNSLYHFDGAEWTAGLGDLNGADAFYYSRFHNAQLLGFAADDVYFASVAGEMRHWDGTQWTLQETSVSTGLRGLWGASTNDIWAVGEGGTMLRRRQ